MARRRTRRSSARMGPPPRFTSTRWRTGPRPMAHSSVRPATGACRPRASLREPRAKPSMRRGCGAWSPVSPIARDACWRAARRATARKPTTTPGASTSSRSPAATPRPPSVATATARMPSCRMTTSSHRPAWPGCRRPVAGVIPTRASWPGTMCGPTRSRPSKRASTARSTSWARVGRRSAQAATAGTTSGHRPTPARGCRRPTGWRRARSAIRGAPSSSLSRSATSQRPPRNSLSSTGSASSTRP